MSNETLTFLFIAYAVGTGAGYWLGLAKGRISGVEATIDQLIETGYLKFRGHKNKPETIEIVKHDEE
jgi:hypothetical protein|tara:strand:- start:215 stop:415 length:201 start_codon:yes stop_codon:yes gene_type:complete